MDKRGRVKIRSPLSGGSEQLKVRRLQSHGGLNSSWHLHPSVFATRKEVAWHPGTSSVAAKSLHALPCGKIPTLLCKVNGISRRRLILLDVVDYQVINCICATVIVLIRVRSRKRSGRSSPSFSLFTNNNRRIINRASSTETWYQTRAWASNSNRRTTAAVSQPVSCKKVFFHLPLFFLLLQPGWHTYCDVNLELVLLCGFRSFADALKVSQ